MRDQVADERAGARRPAANAHIHARPQEIDARAVARRPARVGRKRALRRAPAQLGRLRPFAEKSIDRPGGDELARGLGSPADLAVVFGDLDGPDPQFAKQACPASRRIAGACRGSSTALASSSAAALRSCDTSPGIGSLADHRRGAAVAQLLAQGQRPGAERLVGALRRRQIRVGVAAWPGLDSRVQVECAAGGGEPQQLEAGHVYGEVEEEVAGPQTRLEQQGRTGRASAAPPRSGYHAPWPPRDLDHRP